MQIMFLQYLITFHSNDILFIREINVPPTLQIELLPAIADTGNEI